ncbi:FRAS1-related extracellular matrix protein 1-like [Xiphophorus hellerii]|uniref:FRAS1-related extracellular matrix protein 1-like n=1 Tax=Xiphophorus hellerii TaxID=8084 RepID=UPI0013B4100E|nr:FRAS1-related extracellular matrix protein 1-like [Xiphophorus hellerii]
MVSRSVASWASAHRTCSLLFNSSLSSVRSRKDAAWMWRLAGRKSFWIGQSGGHDLRVWDESHSAKVRGAPASRDEAGFSSDCVLVENPRRWIPTNCSAEAQHSFICSSETPP